MTAHERAQALVMEFVENVWGDASEREADILTELIAKAIADAVADALLDETNGRKGKA